MENNYLFNELAEKSIGGGYFDNSNIFKMTELFEYFLTDKLKMSVRDYNIIKIDKTDDEYAIIDVMSGFIFILDNEDVYNSYVNIPNLICFDKDTYTKLVDKKYTAHWISLCVSRFTGCY